MTFPADNFRAIDSKERMTGGGGDALPDVILIWF